MISRVAEACFWLHRYMERVESTARMLDANLSLVLDARVPVYDRWHPQVIVTGERERFAALFGPDAAADREVVQRYLVWDERNPVSIASSLRWARENARTIRETINLEMWEALNEFWLWLSEGKGERLWERDRHAFYERVKTRCHAFHGISQATMLHETPFDFMRLGMLLERAGQTARLLDVKFHLLGPTRPGAETAVESAQWLALLRSCSASEAFLKRHRSAMTGAAVAGFLLLEERFPRSVLHALDRAWNFHRRVRAPAGEEPGAAGEIGAASGGALEALLASLRGRTIDEVLEAGLHEELTRVIDATAAACLAVQADFFDPPVPQAAGEVAPA